MDSNFTMGKPIPSVKLSVEALPESKIQEIALDGMETYYRPLTMSENLCKMATKIDFLAEEEGRSDEEEDDEDEEASKKSFHNQQWPWEGIRNHLRQALTEMNVLYDVLAISQSKGPPKKEGAPGATAEAGKYMMFDHAPKETPPSKLHLQIPSKKKGVIAAAEILFAGEKRLKSVGEETAPETDFHMQLLKLRKFWRVRKVGTKLLGDLSYRTAGSDFWHAGNFEVIKRTTDDDEGSTPNSSQTHLPKRTLSAFKVVVGADLRGSATLRISVKRKKDSVSSNMDLFRNPLEFEGQVNPNDPQWHKTLCSAQNVLFCRELFNSLAKEAVQLKTGCTVTPFLVVENKVCARIFPDTEFMIEFVHSLPEEDSNSSRVKMETEPGQMSSSDDIYSLKFAAMRLLLNHHKKQLNIPSPHPTVASFGLTNIQRKAPTRPMLFSQMKVVHNREETPLTERLASMAKHWELKRRVCEVIESLADAIQDPYLQAYWSKVGSPTSTSVRVVIMSAGYEACNKTLVEIYVDTDSVKVVQKDGRVISLSSNLHHIRDYILSLICSHQLYTTQDVCLILGWTVLHFSLHSGVGPRSALGNVGSIMAISPAGNCTVSVRCWLDRDSGTSSNTERVRYEVHVQSTRTDGEDRLPHRSNHQQWLNSEQNAIQDSKWFLLGGEWREVDWEKLYGKHFIQKFESLLTFLKSDR